MPPRIKRSLDDVPPEVFLDHIVPHLSEQAKGQLRTAAKRYLEMLPSIFETHMDLTNFIARFLHAEFPQGVLFTNHILFTNHFMVETLLDLKSIEPSITDIQNTSERGIFCKNVLYEIIKKHINLVCVNVPYHTVLNDDEASDDEDDGEDEGEGDDGEDEGEGEDEDEGEVDERVGLDDGNVYIIYSNKELANIYANRKQNQKPNIVSYMSPPYISDNSGNRYPIYNASYALCTTTRPSRFHRSAEYRFLLNHMTDVDDPSLEIERIDSETPILRLTIPTNFKLFHSL